MSTFNKPTLVTITSPTASGKSYLLNELVYRGIFNRIISTTTRAPRDGERDGIDYIFISDEQSKKIEETNDFFELITFNGVRYGVTHFEMFGKMANPVAPIVILEPQGLEIYERECRKNGWNIFKIYVHVTESVRVERLLKRTISNVESAIKVAGGSTIPYMGSSARGNAFNQVAKETALKQATKAITEHHVRMLGIAEERLWMNRHVWNAVVPGDDLEKAIAMIRQGIEWHNSKIVEPQAFGRVELPLV